MQILNGRSFPISVISSSVEGTPNKTKYARMGKLARMSKIAALRKYLLTITYMLRSIAGSFKPLLLLPFNNC